MGKIHIRLTLSQASILEIMGRTGCKLIEFDYKGKLSYELADISEDIPHGYSYHCTSGQKSINKRTVWFLITLGLLEPITIWSKSQKPQKGYKLNQERIEKLKADYLLIVY